MMIGFQNAGFFVLADAASHFARRPVSARFIATFCGNYSLQRPALAARLATAVGPKRLLGARDFYPAFLRHHRQRTAVFHRPRLAS